MLTKTTEITFPRRLIGACCIVPWMRVTCGADAATRLPDWREQRLIELERAYAPSIVVPTCKSNGKNGRHVKLGGHALPMFDVQGVAALLVIHDGNREQIARVLGKPVHSLTRFMGQHGLLTRWKRQAGPPKGYTLKLHRAVHARLLRVESREGVVHTLRPGSGCNGQRMTNCGKVRASLCVKTKRAATCRQCLATHGKG